MWSIQKNVEGLLLLLCLLDCICIWVYILLLYFTFANMWICFWKKMYIYFTELLHCPLSLIPLATANPVHPVVKHIDHLWRAHSVTHHIYWTMILCLPMYYRLYFMAFLFQRVTQNVERSQVRGIGFDATCSLVVLDQSFQPVPVSQDGKSNIYFLYNLST